MQRCARQRLLAASRRPVSASSESAHRAADRPRRPRRIGVVERADLAARVAQVGDDEAALSRFGRRRQLALRRRSASRRDDRARRVQLCAVDGERRAGAQFSGGGSRRRAAARRRRRRSGRCPRTASPTSALRAAVEQRVPFVPGAVGVAVLQPADEREGRALVVAGGAELQRRVVVEQLGALADLAQLRRRRARRCAAEAADRERRRAPSGTRPARRSSGRRRGRRAAGSEWPRRRAKRGSLAQTSFFSSSAFLASNSSCGEDALGLEVAELLERGHHVFGLHRRRRPRRRGGRCARRRRVAGPG